MKLSLFKKALQREINFIRLLFVTILLLGIFIVFKFGAIAFGASTEEIEKYFNQRDSVLDRAVLGDTSTLSQKIKLKEQYAVAKNTKKAYFYLGKKFNSYGYSFTMLFVLGSITSAVLGFLVLRKGWEGTDNFYLKSSFLISFFTASLFGVLPQVFLNKGNTQNNLDKYNYYSGIQIDIYNLIKDNKRYIANKQIETLDSLISNINSNIKANQSIYFDTDINNIPKDIKPMQ